MKILKPILISPFFLFLFFSFPGLLHAEENSTKAAFQEGLLLEKEGRLTEAEGKFIQALQFEPANPDYHFELASLYAARYDSKRRTSSRAAALEMLDRASRELQQAIMFRPDFLEAHYNLGVIYKRAGEFERAREEFKQVLEINPNSSQALIQTGMTYEEQGFFDEAKDEYLKARDLDFYNPEIKSLIADLDDHKVIAHQREVAKAAASSQWGNLQNGLGSPSYNQMNPYGPAAQDSLGANQNQGASQALPYLASMLAQEFMARFSRAGKDE